MLPLDGGGFGFRSLHDIFKALMAKLWYNFRTSHTSIWSQFMWNKYCKKDHPCIAKKVIGSLIWNKMVVVKEEIEHNIWWQLKDGSCSFWFDNWTENGALYFLEEKSMEEE